MNFQVDVEFVRICTAIVNQKKGIEEWAIIESDDMFQEGKYEGGFDATEMAFCFSVYIDSSEYWFQLTLEEIRDIAEGKRNVIEIHPAQQDQ
ncbi:MAG: hypothetical protein JXA82_17590 [Sedimentisphaerales bacterium]|nr:hypothetical protein [Sedimentisphaerales bacterium]